MGFIGASEFDGVVVAYDGPQPSRGGWAYASPRRGEIEDLGECPAPATAAVT